MRFKIGERVRMARPMHAHSKMLVGREGEVVASPSLDGKKEYSVKVDGHDAREYGYTWESVAADDWQLEKRLPDTSSFKPADISIDDLMHSLRKGDRATVGGGSAIETD